MVAVIPGWTLQGLLGLFFVRTREDTFGDLADLASLSPFHFNLEYKKETSLPPHP